MEIFKHTFKLIAISILILISSACSKRSNCPTYWDSDPKMMFNEKSVEAQIKSERGMPTSPKKFKKEADLNGRKHRKQRKKSHKKRVKRQKKRVERKFGQ